MLPRPGPAQQPLRAWARRPRRADRSWEASLSMQAALSGRRQARGRRSAWQASQRGCRHRQQRPPRPGAPPRAVLPRQATPSARRDSLRPPARRAIPCAPPAPQRAGLGRRRRRTPMEAWPRAPRLWTRQLPRAQPPRWALGVQPARAAAPQALRMPRPRRVTWVQSPRVMWRAALWRSLMPWAGPRQGPCRSWAPSLSLGWG